MAFPRVGGLRGIEFGNPGASRDALTALVLDGQKRATAGLLEWDYKAQGEVIEHVGERLAMLDSAGRHVGTLGVTRVEVTTFDQVSDEFALAEAEGDNSGDEFRASHLDFWTRCGYQVDGSTEVVLLYFDLLEDLRNNLA